MGRHKNNRLTRIEVPEEEDDGNLRGWRVLCTEAEVHDMILSRNHKHMNQASETPFGHGKGYEALYGYNKATVME